MAALVFLDLNNIDFHASEDEFADMVLAVARREMSKAQAAVFIRSWSKH